MAINSCEHEASLDRFAHRRTRSSSAGHLSSPNDFVAAIASVTTRTREDDSNSSAAFASSSTALHQLASCFNTAATTAPEPCGALSASAKSIKRCAPSNGSTPRLSTKVANRSKVCFDGASTACAKTAFANGAVACDDANFPDANSRPYIAFACSPFTGSSNAASVMSPNFAHASTTAVFACGFVLSTLSTSHIKSSAAPLPRAKNSRIHTSTT